MSPGGREAAVDPVEARLDDIARLLTLLVARDRTLQDLIAEMDAVGIPRPRIAGLVGRPPNYVSVAVERAKKKAKAPKGAKSTGA
jgi:hypothetical protein